MEAHESDECDRSVIILAFLSIHASELSSTGECFPGSSGQPSFFDTAEYGRQVQAQVADLTVDYIASGSCRHEQPSAGEPCRRLTAGITTATWDVMHATDVDHGRNAAVA